MSIRSILPKFKSYLKRKKLSNNTITAYLSDLNSFLEETEIESIKDLNSDICKDYIEVMLNTNAAAKKTISRRINSLRKFINWLYSNQLINSNFSNDLEHPELESKSIRFLNQAEITTLRHALTDKNMLLLASELVLNLGLRISELLSIEISEIDLANRIINIEDRKITINTKLSLYLKDYIEKNKLKNFLFETSVSTKYYPKNFRVLFDDACTEERLFITFNDLRNTCIVTQLKSGVNLATIQNSAGLTSAKSLQRYIRILDIDYKESKKNLVEV